MRLEGHIEPDEFFDLADRMGVLTLPGWECCDKWEGQVNGSEKGDPWTAADYPVAKASMTAEAERLRDHPSVISFLIGSDFAPDATIEKNYLDALNAADWPDSSGKEVSRNVYWLSTKADTLDWGNSDWYYTPTTSYADLSGLNGLAQVAVDTTASSTANGDGTTTTKVTLTNSSSGKVPAFFVDAHVVGAAGAPVLPVRWTDNQVSLWPGESTTLTATYRTADLRGAAPSVRVSGWNTGTKTIPAG